MAILFEDDKRRFTCSKCGSKLFYKKKIYSFLESTDKNYKLEEYEVGLQILCSNCNKVLVSQIDEKNIK